MQNRISSEGKRTWSREARFQDRFRIGAGACYITSEPQAALSKLCIRNYSSLGTVQASHDS